VSAAPRVLVTDAARGSAIAVIRSLGRRGVEVVAADHHPRSPGFSSRYVRGRVVYPRPDGAPDAAVEVLRREAEARGVDLIVPVSDDILLPLAHARERFAGVCALAIPEPEALAVATDKLATLELARRLGVPTPRTALARTVEEALAAAPSLGWPLVVKPLASRVYRAGVVEAFEVGYADGPGALAEQVGRLEGRCAALLQEYRTGEGHGVELLCDAGRPLLAFQHRRLHEVPITGGASSLREGVRLDPVLFGHAARLLGALRWTGLAMVEFRTGPDGPVLMEINGRIWGSLPLAVKSGVDFPARLVALHLGGRGLDGAADGGPAPTGIRSRNLGLELVWIGSVLRRRRRYPFLRAPSRRQALTAALRLAWPRDGFDLLAADDPLPAVADLAQVGGRLARKVRHAA
jgi:predicted ATP-grasp superfamily ATP-dependent carboligase